MERLTVLVDHKHNVFVAWIEGSASGTLTLEPEHAIEIGRWGEMAKARKLIYDEDK